MTHNRYLFDTDFSARKATSTGADLNIEIAPKDTEQSAYERGYAAGQSDFQNDVNTISHHLLTQILSSIEELRTQAEIQRSKIEGQILNAIIHLASCFLQEIRPDDILKKAEFGFTKILNSLDRDANLVLSVSQNEFDIIKTILSDRDPSRNPIIRIDDTLAKGSFELTWADGGIHFNKIRLQDSIANIAPNYAASNYEAAEELRS